MQTAEKQRATLHGDATIYPVATAYRGHILVDDLELGLSVYGPDRSSEPITCHEVPKTERTVVGETFRLEYRCGGFAGDTPERAMRAFADGKG